MIHFCIVISVISVRLFIILFSLLFSLLSLLLLFENPCCVIINTKPDEVVHDGLTEEDGLMRQHC